jgi:hypothetical protein
MIINNDTYQLEFDIMIYLLYSLNLLTYRNMTNNNFVLHLWLEYMRYTFRL